MSSRSGRYASARPRRRTRRGSLRQSAPSPAHPSGGPFPELDLLVVTRKSPCAGDSSRRISLDRLRAPHGVGKVVAQRGLREHAGSVLLIARDRHVAGDHQIERQACDLDRAQRLFGTVVRSDHRPEEVVRRIPPAILDCSDAASLELDDPARVAELLLDGGAAGGAANRSPTGGSARLLAPEPEQLAEHAKCSGQAKSSTMSACRSGASSSISSMRSPRFAARAVDAARREGPRDEAADAGVQRRVELDDVRHPGTRRRAPRPPSARGRRGLQRTRRREGGGP